MTVAGEEGMVPDTRLENENKTLKKEIDALKKEVEQLKRELARVAAGGKAGTSRGKRKRPIYRSRRLSRGSRRRSGRKWRPRYTEVT